MPSWKKVIISGSNAALNSLNVTTSLTASGLIYPTTDGTSGQFVTTDGAGNLSFSNIQDTTIIVKNVSGDTIPKGTPCYITGSGTSGNIVGIIPADAGNPALMPAGIIAGETLADGAEGVGLLNGFISNVDTSLFASGDQVYVAVGGGYTNIAPTGSALVQKLGNVEKVHPSNGSGVINGPGAVRSVPNINPGYLWVGNSDWVATAVATSSIQNVVSASFASTASYTPAISGTDNYIPKFNGTSALENSLIYDNGTNVGIGTTSPGYTLDVNGSIRTLTGYIRGANTSADINIDGSVGSRLRYANQSITLDSSNATIGTNNTPRLFINNTGNVGIGTTAPGAKLDVEGDVLIKAANLSNQENTDVDTGTEVVATVAIATYTAAFFDFVVKNGTNVRSGTVFACHDGTNVEYTETSTNDLGNTSALTLSVDISSGNMRLLATATSDNWIVKSFVRAI